MKVEKIVVKSSVNLGHIESGFKEALDVGGKHRLCLPQALSLPCSIFQALILACCSGLCNKLHFLNLSGSDFLIGKSQSCL